MLATVVCLLAAAAAPSSAPALIELHVVATANTPHSDQLADDGTALRPHASLTAARNAIRALPPTTRATTNIRVVVHAGVYPPLSLTATDSGGSAKVRIVWAVAGDGPVVISAGLALPVSLFA
jgi:hypothetical protein